MRQTDKTIRVQRSTVTRTSQMARFLKIAIYLAIAYLLFSQARAQKPAAPTHQQSEVKFEHEKIKLGSHIIDVEIADDDLRRARGLMFRTKLPEGSGMLFIFEEEQPLSFWMKNTLIPLSIGYFDKDKKLIESLEMVPASPMEIRPKGYPSKRPAMYALEMPKGWFEKHKIKSGASFSFVSRDTKTRP